MVRKTDVTLPGDYPAPLAAQIPGVAVHQAYVDRAIEGVAFYDLLDYCAANQVNISTVGDTGAGKTMAKRAWCAARGWAYVRIPCNGGFDPDTVFGTTEIIDGETIWTPGLLPLAIEHGRALIDFDEVNFAPPKMMAVFHGLLDDHGVLILNGVAGGTKIIPRHPETLISASWNEDYAGTQPLNEATKDRLGGITVDWPYLRSVEESLVGFDFVAVEGAEAEWRTAHALLDVADKLRMAYREGDLITPVSTRKLQRFVENVIDFGYKFAVTNFVNQFHADERPKVREYLNKEQTRILTEFGLEVVATI